MPHIISADSLAARVGDDLGASDWVLVDQDRIDRFAAAILGRAKVDASGLDQQAPRLRFTSLGGHQLDLTWLPHKQPYAGQANIDGQPVDYPSWPLHGNPWVRQQPGDPALELKHGKDRLSYDFATWTRRAWRDEGP